MAPKNMVSWLALGISLVALVQPYTPLALYTYHKAVVSIVDRADNVSVDYNPASRSLRLSFQVTLLNSGNRDGEFTAESAKLTDVGNESDFIPFDNSDIQLSTDNKHFERTIIVPKDNKTVQVTCVLDYQKGDLGLRILGTSNIKSLTVRFSSGSVPQILNYHLYGWTPNLLQSHSNVHLTTYDR